jgi:hypothetical protein
MHKWYDNIKFGSVKTGFKVAQSVAGNGLL